MQLPSNQIRTGRYFQDLMLHRVHDILLVASPYDAFILEEDGKLTEQILSEYIGMNLSYAPRILIAHSAKNAIEMIDNRFFDIIIVMTRISDMDPIKFSKKLKEFLQKEYSTTLEDIYKFNLSSVELMKQ